MVQQARAVATRAQIVLHAAEAFEKAGFAGASLGTILASAGTTKGALYFHFRSKEALARFIIAEQHRISIASVEAIGREHASAIEQIVMLCHEMARQIVEDPVVRAGIRITLELSAAADGPADPYLDWITTCERLVRRAIEEGDLRADLDPPSLARFVIGAFTGVQTVSQVLAHRTDLEQRVDEMWTFLLPGIMPAHRHRDIERIRTARSMAALPPASRSSPPAGRGLPQPPRSPGPGSSSSGHRW
ncbi:ScbR family autoregulator-binding transcription factor [Rhodococcus opacus]|uniref:ScbR family autoregulator-binding transcription factor n=1 Tax=Rhodococcus opacus TaxID=37919 RepID=UPI00042F137B|nr:ScbR family autoregulator-binding transcription factor [Rhodococcus opacus]AHK35358.1 A-factor receptor protein [Rhodococcus opacus PD630]UDH01653.1 TetR/AcrR family transcriptional regulator [Rhodococcus opacus PD630]